MTFNEAIYWLQHYGNVTYNFGQQIEGLQIEQSDGIDADVQDAIGGTYPNAFLAINYAIYCEGNKSSKIDLSIYGGVNAGFGCIRSSTTAATLVNYTGIAGTGEAISGNPFGYSKNEHSTSTDTKLITGGAANGGFVAGSAGIVDPSDADHPNEHNYINGVPRHFDAVCKEGNQVNGDLDEKIDFFMAINDIGDIALDDDGQYTLNTFKTQTGVSRVVILPVICLMIDGTTPSTIFVYPRANRTLENCIEY